MLVCYATEIVSDNLMGHIKRGVGGLYSNYDLLFKKSCIAS